MEIVILLFFSIILFLGFSILCFGAYESWKDGWSGFIFKNPNN